MTTQKALLVIDMQKGSFEDGTPRHDTQGVVARINRLSEEFRDADQRVIFVQHDGTRFGAFVKGTTAWELLDELVVKSDDILLDKYANDVFYRSELAAILDRMGINELVVTGCATDFCVESTIQSALVKDYTITVVSDGHTTGNRPHMTADLVVEHYNWVWKNMIPTNGKIEVKSCQEVCDDLD